MTVNPLTFISNFLLIWVWRLKYFPICKLALTQNMLQIISISHVKYHSFISCGVSQCWQFSYLVFDKISGMRFSFETKEWRKTSENHDHSQLKSGVQFMNSNIKFCLFFFLFFIYSSVIYLLWVNPKRQSDRSGD